VSEFVPAFAPLTFHWYDGVKPPCVGKAVKVTELPTQNGFADGDIVMLTGNNGLTVTGYWILVTGFVIVQGSEDVNTQDTRSPSLGMNEKTGLLAPAFAPFSFHWYEGVMPP
jgi:hypothetical protein